MLALCLSASVSLQSHKMWHYRKGTRFYLAFYDVSVRCHGVARSEAGDYKLVLSFHLFRTYIPSILLSLFCNLVLLVFLSFVLIQLIRSCDGYFLWLRDRLPG
jgi:hypothetical protein